MGSSCAWKGKGRFFRPSSCPPSAVEAVLGFGTRLLRPLLGAYSQSGCLAHPKLPELAERTSRVGRLNDETQGGMCRPGVNVLLHSCRRTGGSPYLWFAAVRASHTPSCANPGRPLQCPAAHAWTVHCHRRLHPAPTRILVSLNTFLWFFSKALALQLLSFTYLHML